MSPHIRKRAGASIKGPSDDLLLIRSCIQGHSESWARLIRRYERLVYSIAHILCPDESSDIFQQVCLELYERLGQLRDEAALPKWLITVTRRKCYAVLRARKDDGTLVEEWDDRSSHLDRIEKQHAVELCVAQLPDKCQQLVYLLYHEQLSYAEVSAKLNIPVSSIGPTRARCLAKLKQMLG